MMSGLHTRVGVKRIANTASSHGSPLSSPSPVDGGRNQKSISHTAALVPYFAPPALRQKSSFDDSSFVNFALFVVNFLLLQNLLQQFLHRLRVQKADNLILFPLDTPTFGQHVVLGNVAAHRLRSFQFLSIHHLLPDRLALSG